MDEFLKQLQLSDNAISIYLKSIGKLPLTYHELYAIIQNISIKEFEKALIELLNANLLVQLIPKIHEVILHYLAIPPFGPIISYFENIHTNLSNIKNSIQELMVKSLNKIFQNNNIIDFEIIFKTFENIKKDIDEDTIIQKQEVEDIVKEMEQLKDIKEELVNFNQKILNIIQVQFSEVTKLITTLKTEIINEITSLEFKKYKEEIINTIEQAFKAKLDKLLVNFTNKLNSLIEDEFKTTSDSLNNLINKIFQNREDFKLLLLDMLNNFETKMNAVFGIIKENKDAFPDEIKKLEDKISMNLNILIRNSIDEVSNLNKPIEEVIKNYYQDYISSDKPIFENMWIIRSTTKINEEIQNLITYTKEELIIIIPNLENHLALEQFGKKSEKLKLKIASSEAHTNSLVKKYKNIKNLEYKTLQNEDIIALRADNNYLIIGVIKKDTNDPLNDFVGLGVKFPPLIKMLEPLIETTWAAAYSDTFHAAQQTKIQPITHTKILAIKPSEIKNIKPIVSTKTNQTKLDEDAIKVDKRSTKTAAMPKEGKTIQSQEVKKFTDQPHLSKDTRQEKITDLTKSLRENLQYPPQTQTQLDDKAELLINNAFNNLIQKLNNLKGEEFSLELQKIADLILEKKGFSVLLHQLRSTINKYKTSVHLLDDNEITQIINEISSWKNKLFQL